MKTKKLFLFLIMGLKATFGFCCSCEMLFFCEFIHKTTVHQAFKAIVIEEKDYGDDNLAVYLRVIKKYKEKIATTDTIKLYGRPWSADCSLLVHQYNLGDTLIFALGDDEGSPIVNPDSTTEAFFEFRPIICSLDILRVKQGKVLGSIKEGVTSYPLNLFEANLWDCSQIVSNVELQEYAHSPKDITIFPNPSNGNVEIRYDNQFLDVTSIVVYSIEGRIIRVYKNFGKETKGSIPINDLPQGVYIFDINCGEYRLNKKVIVIR